MRTYLVGAFTVIAGCLLSSCAATAQGTTITQPSAFTVQHETKIPDVTLKPGDYSIRISDHLADRMLVQIRSIDGRVDETFLGVPAKNIQNAPAKGPALAVADNGKSAMRGFTFPDGQVVEFVYQKKDAVELAKIESSTVLAIDPSAEGIASSKRLSPEDMKIVTLWMLTPTPVGPANKKVNIAAERYHAPTVEQTEAQVPPLPGSAIAASAPAARRPVVARLPKTASDLPLLELLSACLICVGLTLRQRRLNAKLRGYV